MAAERQSEAPFGGKACPESPAPAGHSGRALRLHGSGAVGASPRPCCATPGALPPPGARRPRPGAGGSRRLPPRGLSPAPGARPAPPGVPLPPPPLRLYGRKAGAGLVALRWGAGAARSGALCGAGAAPPPRLLPRPPPPLSGLPALLWGALYISRRTGAKRRAFRLRPAGRGGQSAAMM